MDICVANLPTEVTGSDLREVFESFGRVETADMVKPRPGDESKGSGYVGMPARSEAVCAVLGVHGRSLIPLPETNASATSEAFWRVDVSG